MINLYVGGVFINIISILLEKVLPIFLLIIIGFFYSRIQKDLDIKAINKFNMTLPFSGYMFYSTYKMKLVLNDIHKMSLAIILLLVASYVLIYLLLKAFKTPNLRGFYFSTLFMNVGFLLPILQLQYGDDGLAKGLSFVFVSVILFFSLGTFLVTFDIDKLKNESNSKNKMLLNMFITPLKNPILWATILGASLNFAKIEITDIVIYPIKLMGDIMIPLATILIGYSLAKIGIKEFRLGFFAFAIRLVSGITLSLVIINIIGVTGLTAKVIVLMASLPTAVFAMPMSDTFDANPNIVSSSLVIGTFASIITLPSVIWLVERVY